LLAALATGCVTHFRTGVRLSEAQQRVVASDLAIAGIVSRPEGSTAELLPEPTARFAKVTGGADLSSRLSDEDRARLLASPSELRQSRAALRDLSRRLGHRYVLVGEAARAPTDERKSWIIQVILPIPFLWISFGVPVNYANNVDVPHTTASAQLVDLEQGELLAASFEVVSRADPEEAPEFGRSSVGRALKLMAVERP
jgi:hypothetical protein